MNNTNTFNNGGNKVNGVAKSHFNNTAGKSQTTRETASFAVQQMNMGRMEDLGGTGAGNRDTKVMDHMGGIWGVHQQPGNGGGVRQAYPMFRANPIPSQNRWGGNTGSFTFDPNNRAPSKHTVFEGKSGTARNIDV